jgi:hypothetical protein
MAASRWAVTETATGFTKQGNLGTGKLGDGREVHRARVDSRSPYSEVNFPSGGCEKIDFANFIGVWFLIRNVHPSLSNRLEGILARSFFDCRSLVSRKPIFSNAPVPELSPKAPVWVPGAGTNLHVVPAPPAPPPPAVPPCSATAC